MKLAEMQPSSHGSEKSTRSLKSTVLIWLLIFAIGLSALGCNSGNHSAKQLATGNKIATHPRENKASGLGGVVNGLGKALEGPAKFSLCVATVGGVVLGAMFLDYQVWRLQDKMF
jgi:hypothetical protein